MKASKVAQKKTILLVDDEDSVLVFLKMLLSDNGYAVITALNGKQALATYKSNPEGINLVLMDISMPIMNGIEAAKELLNYNPNVAILLMSGYTQDACTELKQTYFIKKPLIPADLFQAIKTALKQTPASPPHSLPHSRTNVTGATL